MECINLELVILCPFDSGLCKGYFVRLKAKCELTIILDFLSQSFVNNWWIISWIISSIKQKDKIFVYYMQHACILFMRHWYFVHWNVQFLNFIYLTDNDTKEHLSHPS